MSGDSGCCVRLPPLRNVLRVLFIFLCLSGLGYVYLYKVTELNIDGARGWLKMLDTNVLHYNSTAGVHVTTVKPAIPLLTLFTTWPGKETKYNARNNITLRNWARFKPKIRPVFFTSNDTDLTMILKYGWDFLPVRNLAAAGAPVLKTMFVDVMKKYNSRLYGYSNGDILYDKGFIKTLEGILNSKLPEKKPMLIVGQRTNVKNVTMNDSDNTDDLSALAKRGTLFSTWAEDYFITDRSFPWEDIPGVVIGRRGYDNWLVLHACKQKYTVIDATKTVFAIHQTTSSGNHEGHHRPKGEFNIGLLYSIYKKISFGAGVTSCAPWITITKNNTIVVDRRKNLWKGCHHP